MSEGNANTTGAESGASLVTDKSTFAYFAVVSVFIVLGNAVTLVVMCKRKRKKPTDLLLGTLAVTDLVIAAVVFPLLIVHGLTGRWAGGRPSCYLNAFVSMLLLKFSMLVACTIAVDRFLAIDKPLLYRSKINLSRVKIATVAGALYSLIVSVIPLVGMIYMHTAPFNWHLCFYHWAASRSHFLTAVYVVLNVVDTALATSVVFVCNIGVIIYFVKKRNTRKTQTVPASVEDAPPPAPRTNRGGGWKKDLKYARLMAVVSLYFLICFIPIQVLIVLYQYDCITLEPQTIVTCQLHIVSINLLLNPLLHALIRKQYRNAYWFILRHPTVLCGSSTNHQFDFDQREPSDARGANLRGVSLAVIAVSRFRANSRRIDTTGPTKSNATAVPIILGSGTRTETTEARLPPRQFLGPFKLSGAAECPPGRMPAKQLQVPRLATRRTSGTSYFSEPESVPPSPLLQVPALPNFIEERRGTATASDMESDAGTVCSHLANDSRPSVSSIFSEPSSGETTRVNMTETLGSAPAQTSLGAVPAGSHESVSADSNSVKSPGWSPEEYVKPAQEIDGVFVKKSRKRKSRKRKMAGNDT